MDLITGLLKSKEGHNAIFMVVDRLTKIRHIIPYSTDAEGGTTLDAIAWMFVAYVWKLHGLPDNIVSDRGLQFVSSV